jgi:hypothetical protein
MQQRDSGNDGCRVVVGDIWIVQVVHHCRGLTSGARNLPFFRLEASVTSFLY